MTQSAQPSTVKAPGSRRRWRLTDLCYVQQGNPVFHIDNRTFSLAEGDFVHIPMGTTHWFEVLDAPVKVLAGYCPAGEELAFL